MGNAEPRQGGWGIHVVRAMFPKTAQHNITKYYQLVDKALDEQIEKHDITDPGSIAKLKLYSYATIRVENASFNPRDEQKSQFNTLSPHPKPTGVSANIVDLYDINQKLISSYHLDRPFALYDDNLRSPKNSLGNYNEGMGALYKGRGFIQLTGRSNYVAYAGLAGAPEIVQQPERAGEPEVAARILAAYILKNCSRILKAIDASDFRSARAVVNGHHALNHEGLAASYKEGDEVLGDIQSAPKVLP
jgi:putative chitinase